MRHESMYQYVMKELEAAKGRWPTIALEADMSLSTIKKIARREVTDPGVSLIEKLAKYFRESRVA
jgi:hypothetical protein